MDWIELPGFERTSVKGERVRKPAVGAKVHGKSPTYFCAVFGSKALRTTGGGMPHSVSSTVSTPTHPITLSPG
jgi:hypothetical protein